MEKTWIVIDGAQGEGGGQILRTSVGLAAALGLDVRIVNIRARRQPAGLRPQHLAAVKAAAAVCGGKLTGAAVGARELTFEPAAVQRGEYTFDIGTAGSTTLVLQTVLPAMISCEGPSRVTVKGGTHNPMAPCFEYLRDVFGLLASATNAEMFFEMARPGFYPKGGGELHMHVNGSGGPGSLTPIGYQKRGELKRIEVLSAAAASLPGHIMHRQAHQASQRLAHLGVPVTVTEQQWDTLSPGTAVFVRAVFSRSVAGFDALGQIGKPAERVADDAVDGLEDFLAGAGAIDSHAADQLLTIATLSADESFFTCRRVTDHLRTNAEVIRQLTGRSVEITENADGSGAVKLAAS